MLGRFQRARPMRRLALATHTLAPVYAGLTLVLWIALMAAGERSFVALIHAMSTLATSGISPVGGFHNGAAGLGAMAAEYGGATEAPCSRGTGREARWATVAAHTVRALRWGGCSPARPRRRAAGDAAPRWG